MLVVYANDIFIFLGGKSHVNVMLITKENITYRFANVGRATSLLLLVKGQ